MPSRVIRGEINSSDSLSRVSMHAELTFDRLITAADDFGRVDARPHSLKAALFPHRKLATPERISKWIEELAKEGIDGQPSCVRLYTHGGRPYLEMTRWEKHRGKSKRAKSSRYPDPRELPGIPGKSEDRHDDPPGSRGYGVVVKESGVKRREPPGADAPAPETALALVPQESLEVPALPCAPERLLNLIAQKPGTLEAKRAWLFENLPLMVCEVVMRDLKTQQQRNAQLVSLVIRWWNQELRSPGGRRAPPESFDERAQRKRDEWLAELNQEASA